MTILCGSPHVNPPCNLHDYFFLLKWEILQIESIICLIGIEEFQYDIISPGNNNHDSSISLILGRTKLLNLISTSSLVNRAGPSNNGLENLTMVINTDVDWLRYGMNNIPYNMGLLILVKEYWSVQACIRSAVRPHCRQLTAYFWT